MQETLAETPVRRPLRSLGFMASGCRPRLGSKSLEPNRSALVQSTGEPGTTHVPDLSLAGSQIPMPRFAVCCGNRWCLGRKADLAVQPAASLSSSVQIVATPCNWQACNRTASPKSIPNELAQTIAEIAKPASTADTTIGPTANWASFPAASTGSTPYTFRSTDSTSSNVAAVVNHPEWPRM